MTKKINGTRVYLRELTTRDATSQYCQWLNDPEVNKYLETRGTTIAKLKRYIQSQIKNPDSLFLGIFDKSNNKHIGNLKLEPIDRKRRVATFGLLIGDKEYWGKGFGTEASKLIIDYSFGDLGLVEIKLGVIADNVAAIKAYKKAGFKIIGIKKKSINHDGKLFNEVIMEIKR